MKKIILDHDLGSDCDDAGGASILIKAHAKGECSLLAITHAIADHYGAYAICAICEYFGVNDVEVGVNLENNKNSEDDYHACTKFAAEKYFKNREFPKLESNVKILRRIFAKNGKKDITFVTTGPVTTLYELFKTGADEISEKTGRELFCENVCEFVCGMCNFIYPDNREWNIRADVESALDIVNNPATPITFVGNNVGGTIYTGQPLRDCDENYPVRDCYYSLFNWEDCIRNSWDLATTYYALYGCEDEKYFRLKRGYHVEINDNANTKFWEGGIHSYLEKTATDDEIAELLNRAMMYDSYYENR